MGLLRGKIRWTIPGAGTAYSVLHFDTNDDSPPTQADADEVNTKLNAFILAIKPIIPNVVGLTVIPEFEELEENNGSMINVFTTTAIAGTFGSASSSAGWAAAAGAVITWNTSGIRNGRRVRGRTFVVPVSNTAWDVDGTLTSAAMTNLNDGAFALRTAGSQVQLAVYARPTSKTATDGVLHRATSHRVPDMSAILRSRRS